jgi:ABC-type antimicrobial peptide transport system permease subunit
VIDRGPEISMLRTIGVSACDIVRSVILECGALGAIGGFFGLALGAMLSGQFVVVSMRLLTGWRLPFSLPVLPLLGAASLAVLVSSLAGWVPARAAARVQARQQSPD